VALSHFASGGSSIYRACGGSAAIIEGGTQSVTLGAGQFMHSKDGGLYTLVQATVRPTRWMAVAAGLLHRAPPAHSEGDGVSAHTSPASQ
jgi:hypothetical protein